MTSRAALGLMATLSATVAHAQPVEMDAFRAIARPDPDVQITYGLAQSQGIDVFLPSGPGPHPVAILIHGGCWSATTAGREQLRHLGAELAGRGIAVWSLGYRRANETGGGYPGTFLDVGAGIDRMREAAPGYRLDLGRTVVVGHSAGGHLSLWAASRDKAPADSRLRGASPPFMPGSVISLAGVGDLQTFARFVPVVCGPGIIERLSPPGTEAETSPAALPPPDVPVTLVSGELDRLVPPYVAHDYAVAMRAKRRPVELVTIPGAGHFDLVTPGVPGWTEVRRRIEAALGVAASDR